MEAWHFQVPAHFSLLPDTTASSELGEIISLKVMVALGAFNVLVCDQSSNIVDIKIQGSESNLLAPRETLLACACVRACALQGLAASRRSPRLAAGSGTSNLHFRTPEGLCGPQCGPGQHPQEGGSKPGVWYFQREAERRLNIC